MAQELGRRLRDARRRFGLKQEQVAEAIGTHRLPSTSASSRNGKKESGARLTGPNEGARHGWKMETFRIINTATLIPTPYQPPSPRVGGAE